MALKKKVSKHLAPASLRLGGMIAIDPNLDLGGGVTVEAFRAEHDRVAGLVRQLNDLLTQQDGLLNDLKAAEKSLAQLNSRVLSLVKGRFGADSSEYEQVGGVRMSERKRVKTRTAEA